MPRAKKQPKEKPAFVIADQYRIVCKECGGQMDYPSFRVPLIEFITDAFAFFEKHEHCDTEELPDESITAEQAIERAGTARKLSPKDSAKYFR